MPPKKRERAEQVIEAYAEGDAEGRWLDVEVPPFCSLDDDDRKTLENFETAVMDRLLELNTRRAEEENIKGLGAVSKLKKSTRTSKAAAAVKAIETTHKGKPPAQQLLIAGTEPTDTD